MYPCFSPQWRDLQKIRYFHGELKLRLAGADDPFQIHFPASAQIHKPLALLPLDRNPHKTWDHYLFPSSSVMLSICPRIHSSRVV